jgi:hypothetical protein
MYELEQALVRLQGCECRKSCKWRPAAAATTTTTGGTWRPEGPEEPSQADTTAPTTDKLNARLATATAEGPQQQAIQLKEDGQVWRDDQDKCNVCSCHVSAAR